MTFQPLHLVGEVGECAKGFQDISSAIIFYPSSSIGSQLTELGLSMV